MKRKNHPTILTALALLCWLLTGTPARAQRPQASTADAPVWYYIQVLGDGDRTGRVMTEEDGGDVHGRALVDSDDRTETAPQQWRVETDGDGYRFVNRRSGRYLNVRHDGDRAIGVATTTAAFAATFRLSTAPAGDGSYFNIAATRTPDGVSSSEVYLHQANAGGARDYVIMMVGTGYSGSENSAFRFVEFEDHALGYSDAETTRWYRIRSAKSALAGQCLQQADRATAAADGVPFFFAEERAAAPEQEWKLVRNDDGTTALINRATGDAIRPETTPRGLLNIVQSAIVADSGTGWTLTYIGAGQYVLSGTESDGIARYWNAADESALPDAFTPSDGHQDSGFAFRFELADETPTSVGGAARTENLPLKVSVENGRISVEGHAVFTIHSTSGLRMNRAGRLPAGIYIVSTGGAGGESAKVHVP